MCWDLTWTVAEIWCCSERYLWLWVAFWWQFLVGGVDCSVLLLCGLHKLPVGKLDLLRGGLTQCHSVLHHGLDSCQNIPLILKLKQTLLQQKQQGAKSLEKILVENTGWHHGETRKNKKEEDGTNWQGHGGEQTLLHTHRHTDTHTNKAIGYRWSEEGKTPVREGTEKQWKNTQEELKSKKWNTRAQFQHKNRK